MEKNVKAFWKYIKSFRGVASLDTVFLKWAANQNLGLRDAQKLWKEVNEDVITAFGKKEAITETITRDGTPEELAEMKKLEEQSPQEIGALTTPSLDQDMPGSEETKELSKELDIAEKTLPKKDLLSSLADEDEAGVPISTEENASTEIPELPPEPIV